MRSQIPILAIVCIWIKPIRGQQTWRWERYGSFSEVYNLLFTCHHIMETIYADVTIREQDLGPVRYSYEDTPHYQMGYVYGEIMDRYKKMVEQFKRLYSFKYRGLYEYLDALEINQKMFFEIYHFVNMMHEIPQKYKSDTQYIELVMTEEEKEQHFQADKAFFESAEQQKKESKKALKKELAEKQRIADLEADAAGGKGAGAVEEVAKAGGSSGILSAVGFNLTGETDGKSSAKVVGQGQGPVGLKPPFGNDLPFPLDYGWELDNW